LLGGLPFFLVGVFLGRWVVGVYPLFVVARIMVPLLQRVTFEKAPKVTKSALLLVGPDFVGYPHSDDAPWARAERASMP
jgi:hypothetical protein